jgi:hypothetical protein
VGSLTSSRAIVVNQRETTVAHRRAFWSPPLASSSSGTTLPRSPGCAAGSTHGRGGAIVTGMERQGYDVSLTRYPEGWRATSSGRDHSTGPLDADAFWADSRRIERLAWHLIVIKPPAHGGEQVDGRRPSVPAEGRIRCPGFRSPMICRASVCRLPPAPAGVTVRTVDVCEVLASL